MIGVHYSRFSALNSVPDASIFSLAPMFVRLSIRCVEFNHIDTGDAEDQRQ
jgi:hypothetical protein